MLKTERIRQIRLRLAAACAASLAVILLAAFQWPIVDIVTPLLIVPLMIVAWVFFLGAAIGSLTCIIGCKILGRVALLPLAVLAIAFGVVYFVPFTRLWLDSDFAYYRSEREGIVRKVEAGELRPNVGQNLHLISLGEDYPTVSKGGNQILVEEHSGKKYVFFYTFRGILDNYSGFIYVPAGGNPKHYSDLIEESKTEIVPLGGNWYFASHH